LEYGAPLYYKVSDSCALNPNAYVGQYGGDEYTVGAEIPPTDFVSAEKTIE
jgi:hypothetical protein